jgi:hypothetical protein
MRIKLAKGRRNNISAFEEFFFFYTQVARVVYDPL